MSEKKIKKAEEIVNSRTAAVRLGAGVCLSLLDHEGYPTTSCLSISKADGIRQIYFAADLTSNKAKRAAACSRASLCLFDDKEDSYYNITLVGDVEIITDPAVKKDVWYDEGCAEHFPNGGMDDPNYCVLRFTTKRYSLWLDFEEEATTGSF